MPDELVSVIIPTYNRAELTKRAIRSVVAQSYKNLEIIVIDDGSEVAESLEIEEFDDSRLCCTSISHSGVSAARNIGIHSSIGKYIALLDSDDEWMPDKIALQVELLEQHPNVGLCHTEEEWIRNGKRVNPRIVHQKANGEAFQRSIEMCCISPSAVLIRREVFSSIGLFDERMRVCEDYDLWLRLTARQAVKLLSSRLVRKYGGHQDQLSQSEPAIDRFRVFALCKLLSSADLDAEQIAYVNQGIRTRISVLCIGAKKRNNFKLKSLCEQIEELLLLGNIRNSVDVYTQLIEPGIVEA